MDMDDVVSGRSTVRFVGPGFDAPVDDVEADDVESDDVAGDTALDAHGAEDG